MPILAEVPGPKSQPTRVSQRLRWVGMTFLAALAGVLLAAAGPVAAKSAPSRCSPPPSLNAVAPSDGGLRYRFMGTTTMLFDDGETQILIDGFFSRPSLARAAIGRVRPDCARIEDGLRRAGITTRLKAIFVAHAHVDHVLDAPEIAALTGAEIVGSQSVRNVARGHGLAPPRIKEARDRAACGYGKFRITPIASAHSTPNLARGRIEKPLRRQSWAQFYRAGDSFAFLIEHGERSLLVYPSAAFPTAPLSGIAADIVFLGIGGLGRKAPDFADSYWRQVVGAVGAELVYPIHWDDFGRPLSEKLRPMPWPFDNTAGGFAQVRRLAGERGVVLGELPLFDPVAPPASARRRDRQPAAPAPPCPVFSA